ncbi:HET-domain-containing protein [Lophium mytilinum]|uniref:HET-domain-containing protein n=1 Tax=Lophium mytilinum TaxID=390894 RepID=A0A6A6RD27_9PEZI|nr:HET-domain-containing protein [Lophium mytilinum]
MESGSKASIPSAAAPYQYAPLDRETEEIRLIKLLPGRFEDPIRFELCHAPLVVPKERPVERMSLREVRETLPPGWGVSETVEGDYIFGSRGQNFWEHPVPNIERSRYARPPEMPYTEYQPRYEALSYTWGSAENPENAYVVAAVSQAVSLLPVTRNLSVALRYLRYCDKSRMLWVDAVVINQGDENERNEQVKRMANIYKSAERVIIWLGPEADNSKLAINTLDYIAAQVEFTKDSCAMRSPTAKEPDWYDPDCVLPYDDRTWLAVQELLTRSWFSRVWVWQEAHLANKHALVQSGHDTILWSRLSRAVRCMSVKGDYPSPQLRVLLSVLGGLIGPILDFSLGRLLRTMMYQLCSNPRDYIYGLLGLTASNSLAKIEPDYSATVGTVYKDAFLTSSNHDSRVELLQYCDMNTAIADAPSWVPSWSSAEERISAVGEHISSGISRAYFRYERPNMLEVLGVRCATVETATEPTSWWSKDVPDDVRTWAVKAMTLPSRYITGESLETAFALVLLDNEVIERWPSISAKPKTQEWKNFVLNNIIRPGGRAEVEHAIDVQLKSIMGHVAGRTFITTKEGYIGLGPTLAKPEDLVCVFLGCNSPMFLRPTLAGRFLVVGCGYVHGLADANALLGPLPEPWIVQVATDNAGGTTYHLFNSITAQTIPMSEDPRLGPLPEGWEPVRRNRVRSDPETFGAFRNKITGEEMNSDPRMLPEVLKARGVPLETFQLT